MLLCSIKAVLENVDNCPTCYILHKENFYWKFAMIQAVWLMKLFFIFSLLNKPSEESSQPKCDGDKPSKEDELNDSASHDPYYPPVIRSVSLIIFASK